jgi:hypothetical protein
MNEDKIILTDCDGVVLNWEYAFHVWMKTKGWKRVQSTDYDVSTHYEGLTRSASKALVREFNESASIGFLPPLRDAMHYIDLLHRRHGYVFHMITSLSKNVHAQQLRIENTRKLFGQTAFERFVFLDTGEDKHHALDEYRDTDYIWFEDKPENAVVGSDRGLNSVLMEHGHNMDFNTQNQSSIPLMKNWEQFYREYT